MKNLINGILSTPMTPFEKDGKLALGKIEPFVKWQKENGVDGFYILGTWGGFALLSIDERRRVAEAYAMASKKYDMQLMIHIGAHSYNETIEFGKHAIETGATAISLTVPGYYSTGGYLKMDDYKRYFGSVAEHLNFPLFLYNNPRTTNILFEPNEFVELVRIGVAGVKDGSKNIAWVLKAQNYLKESGLTAEIIPGNSVGILYAFLYRCTAVTSGASVVFPKETSRIVQLINEHNFREAAEQHRLVLKLREAMSICSAPPSAAHYLLENTEHDLGFPKSTWPTLSDSKQKELSYKIDSILSDL